MERLMTPYTILQELVLQSAGIAMMPVTVVCWAGGAMSAVKTLIGQKGIYADFMLGRKEAVGWRLGATPGL